MKQPMQPIVRDSKGVIRFKVNAIVNYLEVTRRLDLNAVAYHDYSDDDRRQIAQLLGYSIEGYAELPYVGKKHMRKVDKAVKLFEQTEMAVKKQIDKAFNYNELTAKIDAIKPPLEARAFCPICAARVVNCERSPDGKSTCENGHKFPNVNALTHERATGLKMALDFQGLKSLDEGLKKPCDTRP